MAKKILLVGFILVFNFLVTNVEAKPKVYVVNYPLQYFAERLGGDLVEVKFPAPPQVDPALWVPDAKTIQAYQTADLILLNGAGYAKWIQKVSLPRSKLVDTSAAFKEAYISVSRAPTHSHGPGGEHSHGGWAATTWLNFDDAAQQAQAVGDALKRLIPEEKNQIEANLQGLKKDLLVLDRQLKEISAKDPNQALLASHPVYQYLSRRYGLNLKSLHWEPNASPNKEQWEEFKILHSKHPAKWMIWEGPPLEATREKLQLQGVGSVVFNPCGNRPAQGDFISVMKKNVNSLAKLY